MDHEDLKKWFEGRPKWLQECAIRIINYGSLSEKDYSDLVSLCKAEAEGKQLENRALSLTSVISQDNIGHFDLVSIDEVKGVNAIDASRPLEFEVGKLNIVYGRNGTGKSGYVRLLKHICGKRNRGTLLRNIFSDEEQDQSAKISYIENEERSELSWKGEPLKELGSVEIYDTDCGYAYVDQENELTYEPAILQLFTLLTDVSKTINDLLDSQKSQLQSILPNLPREHEATEAGNWYKALTIDTNKEEVEEKVAWSPEEEKELNDINIRLSETDPSQKANQLRGQERRTIALLNDLKILHHTFEEVECTAYLDLKKEAKDKRKAADDDANKVFSNAPLNGVGTESWRLLWEAARSYSENEAYSGQPFPVTAGSARCVLCQRELDEESRQRFESFESYVKGELQDKAKQAEEQCNNSNDQLNSMLTLEELEMRLDAAAIHDGKIKQQLKAYLGLILKRKEDLLVAEEYEQIDPLPDRAELLGLINIARQIAREARAYEKDAKDENRDNIVLQQKELNAKKWVSQQQAAIKAEIERLSSVAKLEKAMSLTNTNALSRKKSALTEVLITNEFIKRFSNELSMLQASTISIDLKKSRTEVGKVYHKIFLKEAKQEVKNSSILSEGEFRIISLAAFLADTEGRDSEPPFIFDDPISSLDHVYEEATAQRLVELCGSRQVIVFTHRLSLLGFLSKYAKKNDVKLNIRSLSEYKTGQVMDFPINLGKTKNTIIRLLNEKLKSIKDIYAQGNEAYQDEAKNLSGHIRILLERIVEKDLLNEIVQRFSPEVQTKGKIHSLAEITTEECEFVDFYMTKYSRYEHSQPDEAPVSLPKPEEFEEDLNAIKGFLESIQSRKN